MCRRGCEIYVGPHAPSDGPASTRQHCRVSLGKTLIPFIYVSHYEFRLHLQWQPLAQFSCVRRFRRSVALTW